MCVSGSRHTHYCTRAHLSRAFLEPVQTVFCASGQLALFSKELSDVALSAVVALHRGVFHSLRQLQLQGRGSGGEGEGGVEWRERGEWSGGRGGSGGEGRGGEGGEEERGGKGRMKCNTTQRDGAE